MVVLMSGSKLPAKAQEKLNCGTRRVAYDAHVASWHAAMAVRNLQ